MINEADIRMTQKSSLSIERKLKEFADEIFPLKRTNSQNSRAVV